MNILQHFLGIDSLQQQFTALQEENTELKIKIKLLRKDLEEFTDIDYDTICDHIDLDEVAKKCSFSFDADDIASHVDTEELASEIAGQICKSEIIDALDIDYSELADHVDIEDLGDHIVQDDQLTEDVSKRLMRKTLIFKG